MATIEEIRQEVRVAQIADSLDHRGLRQQCLAPGIFPVAPEMRFVGRAFTVAVEPVDYIPAEPYSGLLAALDELGPDDVYVIPTGGDLGAAMWGELLSNSARSRGAVAALTDGAVRDVAQIISLGFPTFARGTTPNDIHGRYEVTGHGSPVTVSGVHIAQGDLIAGDVDGVVVVPRHVETEVTDAALAKARTESEVKEALAGGMLPSVAFKRYGVL